MGTYVTANGFLKKTIAEIKSEYETAFKQIFGDNIDLDPDSRFGQLIGILSQDKVSLWELAEEVYFSRNPDQAIGISLDNIVLENAIQRLPASRTTIHDVILYGDDGTVILAGKKAKILNISTTYSLDAPLTISRSFAKQGIIEVDTVTEGEVYFITIFTDTYSYTCGAGKTKTDVLNALKTLIDAGTWTGTTSVANEQLTINDTATTFNFEVSSNLVIMEVATSGNFTCDIDGANRVPANNLTEIVTPVSGWNSVNNINAGIVGRDQETDTQLRVRRESSINNGTSTEEAIRESLLDDVENVSGCFVFSNRTDITDIEGRPPHSFECVIAGGIDQDIGDKIFQVQGAGCESYGNTIVQVTDSQGYLQSVKFSRAVSKYIWVRISRSLYTEEDYPVDGDTQMAQAILDWSLSTTNIDVGKDIIYQRLSVPVYSITGVKDILIEVSKTDTPSGSPVYASADIVLSSRELAEFALTRITIQDL